MSDCAIKDPRATSGHRHREQEETYVVVGGSGRIRLDDETIGLRRWSETDG